MIAASPEARQMAERILVVDDEQSIRTIVEYALRDAGFTVLTAARGDEALRTVEREQVDLVVLDLMLPGVDGLEVCQAHPRRAQRAHHHAVRSRRGSSTRSSGSNSAPTTTSPSRSRRASWSRGSRPTCAGRASSPTGRRR